MTAIADVSVLLNRSTGGNGGNPETFMWWKDPSSFTLLGGVMKSAWTLDGKPGPGSVPGGVASNPTNATAGAFRMLNPSGGRQRWLRSMFASAWGATRIILYDRLMHIGGFSGTVTTANTVNGTVSRYTAQASLGNFIMAEVYSAVGASQVNVSCNYTDKDGNSRASGTALFGASVCRNPGDCAIIPYNTATGANSVVGVTDATLSATTGTAGNWGITVCRSLMEIDVGSVNTSGFGHGARQMALRDTELLANACLGILFVTTGTLSNFIRGNYTSVEA